MKRRSFITALAGLPIVGFGSRMFGQQKPAAKSSITVHGPEELHLKTGWGPQGVILSSLRFENVPTDSAEEVVKRLKPVFGTVNIRHLGRAPACTLMFLYHSVSHPKNGHCSVICEFKSAFADTVWGGSHRAVDFEAEILKALAG